MSSLLTLYFIIYPLYFRWEKHTAPAQKWRPPRPPNRPPSAVAADPWAQSGGGNKVDRVDDTGGLMGPIARQAVSELIAL
jgi:hypothetical protein